jgi:hypothetical protein
LWFGFEVFSPNSQMFKACSPAGGSTEELLNYENANFIDDLTHQ